MNPVLALALLAAAGIALTRLARLPARRPLNLDLIAAAGLPLVLAGLLLGPGVGVLSSELLRAIAPVTALAIGWLGAVFGARFEWRFVRRIPGAALGLAALEASVTFVLLALAAWSLMRLRPALAAAWTPPLPAVLTLGAVAVVSGPQAVALVAHAAGIRRGLAHALGLAAALDTAFGVLGFTLALALYHPRAPVGGVPLGWLSWLTLAVGSGLLAGMLFLSLTRLRPDREDTGLALLGVLLLGAGVGYAADLSPFTVCAIAATVMVNLSPARRTVRRLLLDWEPPLYAVFLLIVGAQQRLPTVWILVAVPLLAGLRIATKWTAVRAGRWVLRVPGWPPNLGIATVAQGGVALALAFNFELTYGGSGALLTTIALGMLCAYVVAPPLMARALSPARLTPPAPAPEVTG